MEITSRSINDTRALATKLAKDFKAGDLIALRGDLGGGKTTFSQSLIRSLGVKNRIVSPTFVLMKRYKLPETFNNIKTVYHFDAYRISDREELKVIGWEEILDDKHGLVIVEWADKIADLLPKNSKWISFKFVKPDIRCIVTEE
ncbi:MAG: tRNA (adenosine(37)-N6)-threonylcarbamoyltransferase complex ATPase subunit type 1 TsaE [bacterium]